MKNQIVTTDITAAAIARKLVAERKRLGLQQESKKRPRHILRHHEPL